MEFAKLEEFLKEFLKCIIRNCLQLLMCIFINECVYTC